MGRRHQERMARPLFNVLAGAVVTLALVGSGAVAAATHKPAGNKPAAAGKAAADGHKGRKASAGAGKAAQATAAATGRRVAKGANAAKGARTANSANNSKFAKAPGPTVVHRASPAAALLPALSAARVNTGCAGHHNAAGLGFTPSQMDAWISAHPPGAGPSLAAPRALSDVPVQAAAPAAGCRHFASIAPDGARSAPTALALMPSAERPAAEPSAPLQPSILVVTRSGSTGEPDTRWVAIDPLPAGLREAWLPLAPTAAALEAVPPVLHTELLLLLRMLRKEAQAPDTAVARVWLLGDDAAATMQALELVDPATGQAFGSTVWLARSEGGGAYISSNGIEVERMLWQSPVDQLRVSRGVGASSMLVKRRTIEPLRKVSKVGRGGKGARRGTRIVVRTFQIKSQHVGIDFAAPIGTPVVAVADGEIEFAGWRGGYGNLVLLRHANDLSTYYAHLSAFAPDLQAGTPVRRGQTIGLVGSTGFSTGPHLHFEIRKANRYIDPMRADVQLPEWTLQSEEHAGLLMRLLQLGATRERSLAGLPQPQLRLEVMPQPGVAAALQPGS